MTGVAHPTFARNGAAKGSKCRNWNTRIGWFALHLMGLCTAVAICVPTASAQLANGIIGRSDPKSAHQVDHGAWSRLLKTYVKPGSDGVNRVDYAAFKAGGHTTLKRYLEQMIRVDPRGLNSREQFAFLANL